MNDAERKGRRRGFVRTLSIYVALILLAVIVAFVLGQGWVHARQSRAALTASLLGNTRALATTVGTDVVREAEMKRRADAIRARSPEILILEFRKASEEGAAAEGGDDNAALFKALPVDTVVDGKAAGKHALLLVEPIIVGGAAADGEGSAGAAPAGGRKLGEVRIAYSLAAVDLSARRAWLTWVAFAIVIALLAFFAVHRLLRRMTAPLLSITSGAGKVAGGDLSLRLGSADAAGELGDLSRAFNAMSEGLAGLIRRFRDSFGQVERGSGLIEYEVGQFIEGGREQLRHVEDISATANQLTATTLTLVEAVEQLSASAEETSSSIMQMVASNAEVARNADGLERRVNETATTTEELVYAVREIDKTVERLNEITGSTAAAMAEMDASIRQVERNAEETRALSEAAARAAKGGGESARANDAAMAQIRDTVDHAAQALGKLGKRSEEIGAILGVIDEIAEQTNLLALNAAIIAAQAGEHGKGFAVVAEEIRRLAERTGASTKEIAGLIGAVQTDVSASVTAMENGVTAVDRGVSLSREAGEALTRITDSSERASSMVASIAAATKEQAQGVRGIVGSVEQIRALAESISKATGEQSQGGSQIMQALENMREITATVNRATTEQNRGSSLISEAVSRITEMIGSLHQGIGEQAKGAEVISGRVEGLRTLTDRYATAAGEARKAIAQLRESTRRLEGDLTKFKF